MSPYGILLFIAMMLVWLIIPFFAANVIPDYLSLLETRFILHRMQLTRSLPVQMLLLGGDFFLTAGLAWVAQQIGLFAIGIVPLTFAYALPHFPPKTLEAAITALVAALLMFVAGIMSWALKSYLWFYPAFLTSIWTWLYVGAGLLVRTGRRLDFVLSVSNRLMDIEHKPLKCLGVVAGVICMLLYWAVSLLHSLVA
jgi:hypothetical protein